MIKILTCAFIFHQSIQHDEASGCIFIISVQHLPTVKAKIIKFSGVKVVSLANETLRNRIDIPHPTGTSELLWWEESCNQFLETDVTYIFSNFRLKGRCRSRYLNSPKMGGSSIKNTDAYQEEVQESLIPNMFYQEDTIEFVKIQSISKYNSCRKCRQKMECSDMQRILLYLCRATMNRKIFPSNRVLKISCMEENGETLCLTIFTDYLKQLISEKSLESCIPKELSTYVLVVGEDKVQCNPDKGIQSVA